MLAKNILSVMALGMYALLTVDAGMVQKRDEDPDRNPTNFALFDPYDNPVMPRAKCTVQEADTRRCGEDRHSLWTCKKSEDSKSAAWQVDTDTGTGEKGNHCESKCCRPSELAPKRTAKCTRKYASFYGRNYCWQILKQDQLA